MTSAASAACRVCRGRPGARSARGRGVDGPMGDAADRTASGVAAEPNTFHAGRKRANVDNRTEEVDLVADFYNHRTDVEVGRDRAESRIIHLKNLNNWIKSVLLREAVRPGDAVLDLACGKGGDLTKFSRLGVSSYVGVDVAPSAVQEARNRYNGASGGGQSRRGMPFSAKFAVANCWEVVLRDQFKDDAPFDVVSCQFALHYAFRTAGMAKLALRNVAAMLRPGGLFVGTTTDSAVLAHKLREASALSGKPETEFKNSVFRVEFDARHAGGVFPAGAEGGPFGIRYTFFLDDAIDAIPEYAIPFPTLVELARAAGLEVVYALNFHEFFYSRLSPDLGPTTAENYELLKRMRVLPEGEDALPLAQWEAAHLYLTFAFRKVGEDAPDAAEQARRAQRAKGFVMQLPTDVTTLE